MTLAACGPAPRGGNSTPPDADACSCTPPAATCSDATTLRTFACNACDVVPTDTACSAPDHATPACAAAACDFTCATGYDRVGDHCESQYQVPTGMRLLQGTCTVAHRGWHLGPGDACVRDVSTTMGSSSRAVTIAADADAFAFTTTLRVDPLTGRPYDPYTVLLSATAPTATKDTGSCDPIYGTCITHVWTLAPHALHLATTSLHDNDSSTPLGQCWEYHYDKIDCAFDLTWP